MIYSSIEYRNFLTAAVPGESEYLLAYDRDEIVGMLPYFRAKRANGDVVINSLPWYGSHGGCVISPQGGEEVRRTLLARYAEIIALPEVFSATMIVSHLEQQKLDTYLNVLKPTFLDFRAGQITVLPRADHNDVKIQLEKLLSGKTRNLVRKALKQNFLLVTGNEGWHWKFLYETHAENMVKIGGKAKIWEHFMALRESIPEESRRLMLAILDGKPVAALLLLFFNETVEYFTPAIKQDYRSKQPLSFLIWHGMIDAIVKGYRFWNWGGSWKSQVSLHHFKEGWGAQDHPYAYLIRIADGRLTDLKIEAASLAVDFPYYYTHPYHLPHCELDALRSA